MCMNMLSQWLKILYKLRSKQTRVRCYWSVISYWIGYDYWLLDVIGQMLTDMGVQNRVNPD